MANKIYCAICNDQYAGIAPIGNISRDARVFGIPSGQGTCENQTPEQLQAMHDRTRDAWDKYGCWSPGTGA